jgi:hypothetical protein
MSAPPAYDELDLRLSRIQPDAFQVELRFTDSDPENQAQRAPSSGPAALDLGELLENQGDPDEYGRILARQLFADEAVRGEFLAVRAATEARGRQLRLRLEVAPSAAELQGLRFELLRDPHSGERLATSERIVFFRFLASQDWRPVRLRRKAELKVLLAVAAPADLAAYKLSAIDRDHEIALARQALGGLAVTEVPREERVTLDNLLAHLRGGVDLLYLVSHGALPRGKEPVLFLEDEAGQVARVSGNRLAECVRELPEPPLLVVLASCESGGTADGTTQSALAPALAVAGVPAIVAMQSKISVETVTRVMTVFFTELCKDGQIDRALAVARGTVRDRADAWMPALYLRLKSGRIWYEPGFAGAAGAGGDFARWKSICRRVRQGKFIPIVGPDLGERILGTSRELAGRLAEAEGFPLAPEDKTDLAKVAQYVAISQDREYAQGALLGQLRHQALEHCAGLLGGEAGLRSLPDLLDAALLATRRDPEDPLRILADLPGSIYLTAAADTLLFKSLKAAGREPSLLFSSWRPSADSHPTEPRPAAEPSRERPVVYQVFGVFGKPESLVLTEDDFFDFLIATATYKLIPTVVRGSLTESSLLFLGFRLDSWTFRVLFRLIMTLEGAADLKQFSHVGVQIDPEENSRADAERARRYLESYFGADRGAGSGRGEPRIDLYWGTAADFLAELARQLAAQPDEAAPAAQGGDADGWF